MLATSSLACSAARAAGMRCVGLTVEEDVEDYSDVYFDDLDDDRQPCTFDDLYTPGIPSLNAAHVHRILLG